VSTLFFKARFAWVACGENARDTGDFRPGAKAAAAEFQVRAPLKEAGSTRRKAAFSLMWRVFPEAAGAGFPIESRGC